jgi:hypothetical protein
MFRVVKGMGSGGNALAALIIVVLAFLLFCAFLNFEAGINQQNPPSPSSSVWQVTISHNDGGYTDPYGVKSVFTNQSLTVTAYPYDEGWNNFTFLCWVFDGVNGTSNPTTTIPPQHGNSTHTLVAMFQNNRVQFFYPDITVQRGQNCTVHLFWNVRQYGGYNIKVGIWDIFYPFPEQAGPTGPIFSSVEIGSKYAFGIPTEWIECLNVNYPYPSAPPYVYHIDGAGCNGNYVSGNVYEWIVSLSIKNTAPIGTYKCSIAVSGAPQGSIIVYSDWRVTITG